MKSGIRGVFVVEVPEKNKLCLTLQEAVWVYIDFLKITKYESVKAYFNRKNFINFKKNGVMGMRKEVPIWEKSNLTLEEAAAYSGIGVSKLRELSNDKHCDFVLWNGNKRLIKRKKLDESLENRFSI